MTKQEKDKMVGILRKGTNEQRNIEDYDRKLMIRFLLLDEKENNEIEKNRVEIWNHLEEKIQYFSRSGKVEKMEEYKGLQKRLNKVFEKINFV